MNDAVASRLEGVGGFLTAVGQIRKLLFEVLLEVLTVFLFELLEAFDFAFDRDSLLVENIDFVALAKFCFCEHARYVVLALFDDPVAFGVSLLDVLVVQFASELKQLARRAGLSTSCYRSGGGDWSTVALQLCDTRLGGQNLLVEPIILDLDAAKFLDNLVEEIVDIIGVVTVTLRLELFINNFISPQNWPTSYLRPTA